MQRQGIHYENDIANILNYAKELPNLQQYWENLHNNNHNLKRQNQELEKELQARKRQIVELTEVENMLHQNVDTLQSDIDCLLNERSQLQQFVSTFKNSDRRYLLIKSAAGEHVNRLLREQESLLDLALKAVIDTTTSGSKTFSNLLSSSPDNTVNNSPVDNSGDTTTQSSPPHAIFDMLNEPLHDIL
jgi:chromosome segregation ATPase